MMENFRRAHPDPNAVKDRAILLTPFQESLTENVRTTLWLLLGAVALLLLIACSNLGSLLLARLSARQKEIAVRLALGQRRRPAVAPVPGGEHAAGGGGQRGRISRRILVVRCPARAGPAGSPVVGYDPSRSSGARLCRDHRASRGRGVQPAGFRRVVADGFAGNAEGIRPFGGNSGHGSGHGMSW